MSTHLSAIGCIGLRPIALSHSSPRWIAGPGILAFCFAPAAVMGFLLWISGSGPEILLGQTALAIGTFLALWILSSRPLIDPIQAFVFLFHWWFAIGPAACATFYLATDQAAQAEVYLTGTPTA